MAHYNWLEKLTEHNFNEMKKHNVMSKSTTLKTKKNKNDYLGTCVRIPRKPGIPLFTKNKGRSLTDNILWLRHAQWTEL